MANRLYVGNLNYSVSTEELKTLFERIGVVTDVKILIDRETGRSRGFGFITMSSEIEAAEAMNSFNGFLLSGRVIVVNEATERKSVHTRSYAPQISTESIQVEFLGEKKTRYIGKRRPRRNHENDWDAD